MKGFAHVGKALNEREPLRHEAKGFRHIDDLFHGPQGITRLIEVEGDVTMDPSDIFEGVGRICDGNSLRSYSELPFQNRVDFLLGVGPSFLNVFEAFREFLLQIVF